MKRNFISFIYIYCSITYCFSYSIYFYFISFFTYQFLHSNIVSEFFNFLSPSWSSHCLLEPRNGKKYVCIIVCVNESIGIKIIVSISAIQCKYDYKYKYIHNDRMCTCKYVYIRG